MQLVSPVSFYALSGLPLIEPGDDLAALISHSLRDNELELADGDVLVLAQKIVSKAEGRYVNLDDVNPSEQAHALGAKVRKDPRHVEVVLSESDEIVKVGEAKERITVAEINALLYSPNHPREGLERALRIDALSPGWRGSFEALVNNPTAAAGGGNAGLAPEAVAHAAAPGFRPLVVMANSTAVSPRTGAAMST